MGSEGSSTGKAAQKKASAQLIGFRGGWRRCCGAAGQAHSLSLSLLCSLTRARMRAHTHPCTAALICGDAVSRCSRRSAEPLRAVAAGALALTSACARAYLEC